VDVPEAEKMEVRVMETSRRVLGEEHSDTLISMNKVPFPMKEQGGTHYIELKKAAHNQKTHHRTTMSCVRSPKIERAA
jgi:hypothetical protein